MPSQVPLPKSTFRIGIVGAARTQQGLGPFLATAFEAAGTSVVAVSGRSLEGAGRAAVLLSTRLGHPVRAVASAAELAALVDALVVASPMPNHLEGLDAALAAAVPCLCEKPLVGWSSAQLGLARIESFRRNGLVLEENCQWPFVLPAFFTLHPELAGQPVRHVAMGLGPVGLGAAMVVDSLSHVLSLVQALADLDPQATARRIGQSHGAADAAANVVRFEVAAATGAIEVELHLQHCAAPPRPAWLAINGFRLDRRIGANYEQSLQTADGRTVKVRDPLHQLVYRFVALTQAKDLERTAATASSVALRLRLYADILRALGAGP